MSDKDFVFLLSRLLREAGARSGLSTVDRTNRSILEFIGEMELTGGPVYVKTVVGSGLFGTAPTVFSRLQQLENAGWVERYTDADDGRSRRIVLTSRSRKAFTKMSSELGRLVASAS